MPVDIQTATAKPWHHPCMKFIADN